MRVSYLRLILTALAAFIVMAMTAGTASARGRIEVSATRITATSRGLIFGSESDNLSCDVTLNGTLLRLITKVLREHIGGITEGRSTNCRNSLGESANRLIILLPMTLLYSSITGTLPERINGSVLLIDLGFLVDLQGFGGLITSRCLYEGRVAARARENPIRRLLVESTTDPHQPITRVIDERGNTACPSSATLNGEFRLTPEVSIRLLER